jgi:hypothetical protein
MRHDRFRNHFGREPYPHQMGAACGRGFEPRRVPARSRVPANEMENRFPVGRCEARPELGSILKRFGRQLACDALVGCGAVACGPPSDTEKPAADFPARAFEFLRW